MERRESIEDKQLFFNFIRKQQSHSKPSAANEYNHPSLQIH
jgi:hypothetical protein